MTTEPRHLNRPARPWGLAGCIALALVALSACTVESDPVRLFDSGLNAYRTGDYRQAAEDWSVAAAAGDGVAQYFLADLLAAGRGVARDTARAEALYRQAADKGVLAAAERLADGERQASRVSWWEAADADGFVLRPPRPAPPAPHPPPGGGADHDDPPLPDFAAVRLVVASDPSRDRAERAWAALYVVAPRHFVTRQAAVVRVNQGPGRGLLHEVQVGPFASQDDALALCRVLPPRLAFDCRIAR